MLALRKLLFLSTSDIFCLFERYQISRLGSTGFQYVSFLEIINLDHVKVSGFWCSSLGTFFFPFVSLFWFRCLSSARGLEMQISLSEEDSVNFLIICQLHFNSIKEFLVEVSILEFCP